MSKLNLEDIIQFTQLLNKFQEVNRVIYHPGTTKLENDAEHSYQLAMTAWYLASNNFPHLNKDLVLKYALAHDLVEAYAGDTFIHSKNQAEHDSKHKREEDARIQILKEFPLFEDLHETIINYEKREDNESRFVYVLDKIHPVIQLYLDGGKMWKEREITLQMLLEKKRDKLELMPELLPIWNELEKVLDEDEDNLFFKSNS